MLATLIPSYRVPSNDGSAAIDGELCTLDEARAIGREKDNWFSFKARTSPTGSPLIDANVKAGRVLFQLDEAERTD
jgi:hypothetical protein